MNRPLDVYAIGNAIVDLQVHAEEVDIERLNLKKGGMQLVDAAAQQRLLEHFISQKIHRASGGSAANTIIAVAQLGGNCGYGCLVADDEFGEFYLNEMRHLGIELHTKPTSGGVTGSSLILITPDAERTMNTHLGVSSGFSSEHIDEKKIAVAEWLYIEGYLFSTEEGQRAVQHSISLAKKHQTKVAVTCSDTFICSVFSGPLEDAIKDTDLLFANLEEARAFTGRHEEREVVAALRDKVSNCIVTLSERGAHIDYDGEFVSVDPYPTEAVDTTGAGDIFAGAFLYGVTHGLDGTRAGRLACYLGSKVVSQLGPRLGGDIQSLVNREQLL